jgi:hypothetical protein
MAGGVVRYRDVPDALARGGHYQIRTRHLTGPDEQERRRMSDFHDRWLREQMNDPEFREHYAQQRASLAAVGLNQTDLFTGMFREPSSEDSHGRSVARHSAKRPKLAP